MTRMLFPGSIRPFSSSLFSFFYQLGAGIDLLILVASHTAHYADALFTLTELKAGHPEIVPIEGVDLI